MGTAQSATQNTFTLSPQHPASITGQRLGDPDLFWGTEITSGDSSSLQGSLPALSGISWDCPQKPLQQCHEHTPNPGPGHPALTRKARKLSMDSNEQQAAQH